MTAPLTPPGPSSEHQPGADPWRQYQSAPESEPVSPHGQDPHGQEQGSGPGLATDLRDGAAIAVLLAACGVVLGLLWLWLAPRVQFFSNGEAIFLKDTENEGRIGADGTFLLISLGLGMLTGALVYLFRRRGGVLLVVGLAVGALLGSILGWRLGVWLGPSRDLLGAARKAGTDVPFDAPLQLMAHGALLTWPVAALATHLALTALFAPRDPQVQDDWPQGRPPPHLRTSQAEQKPVESQDPEDRSEPRGD
ncbi:ABC transporter permease [Streptomyces sp. NPDC006879]|uniref:ABC transporter permease n=1 Tax=Streptomyces sp. NPDC006879 TaxID=3364767 RepID=UPI0036B2AC86